MSGGTATREAIARPSVGTSPTDHDADRRRFTIAALIGLGVALIPYLWVLWDHRLDPLRTAWPNGTYSDFYDVQARALFHGHWNVPKDSLNIEAFVVGGKDYMYFGPFSSVLRMPVLAVTDRLDGQLTALSMLLAWLLTGLFSALLVWRVRLLVRGPVVLSRAEAASHAVLLATITSGSVLLYLATMPWVYHEDFAWGAALGIGALFALLGVLERPSAGRVAATGALTLAATLARTTIGWGCVIAILLAAIWFATGRGGEENRRWWLPLLAAGLGPFAIGTAINLVKFGIPFGVPMGSQVFTRVNEHRRDVLAAHGGRLWSPRFVPSTAWAYLRPDGLRLTPVYPFITLPAVPARGLGGTVLDQTYRSGSMTASMPLLFLLGIWGAITAFRPRSVGRTALTRIPLLAAAVATTGILVWGYIAHRYMTEFVPLLVLAAAVGLVDVWRRADGRSRRVRTGTVTAVAAVGAFCLVANLGASSAPTDAIAWEGDRARDYIELQQSISDVTGHPLDENVVRGERLPPRAPADRLFVVGDCAGLYLSTGDKDGPWVPIELPESDLDVTFHERVSERGRVPLVTVGGEASSTVSIETGRSGRIRFRVDENYGYPNLYFPSASKWMPLQVGRMYRVGVTTDAGLHRFSVTVDGHRVIDGRPLPDGPLVVHARADAADGASPALTVVEKSGPEPTLCRSLIATK